MTALRSIVMLLVLADCGSLCDAAEGGDGVQRIAKSWRLALRKLLFVGQALHERKGRRTNLYQRFEDLLTRFTNASIPFAFDTQLDTLRRAANSDSPAQYNKLTDST